jgi:DNA mismatch endonuclease (patch repair protein)
MTEPKVYIRDGRAPIPMKESTSWLMSTIKDKNTKPELALRKSLWNNGIRGYRLHWNKVPGRPDIVFPGKKVAIFVNGCFWHRCSLCNPRMPKSNTEFWKNKFDKNIERDKRKFEQLKRLGWIVINIWECQINSATNKCLEAIKSKLQ